MKVNIMNEVTIGVDDNEKELARELGIEIKDLVDHILMGNANEISVAKSIFKGNLKTLINIAHSNEYRYVDMLTQKVRTDMLDRFENIKFVDALQSLTTGEVDIIGFSAHGGFAVTKPQIDLEDYEQTLIDLNEELGANHAPRTEENTKEFKAKADELEELNTFVMTHSMPGEAVSYETYVEIRAARDRELVLIDEMKEINNR